MTVTDTLLDRNRAFARTFGAGDMPILPRLRSVILTCVDARVDPAHVLGLELGESVVMRNNGGRVTPEVIDEIATLAFLVAQMDDGATGPFRVILMEHTQCGAERFANPTLQEAMKARIGVDVAPLAISDHRDCLRHDIARLRDATQIPDYVEVSALLYDVTTGEVEEVIPPQPLRGG